MSAVPSLYEQLGVAPGVDLATLRRAYREKALQCHPDRSSGDARAMAEVNAAWAVLSDPQRRAAYDRTLRTAVSSRPTRPRPSTRPSTTVRTAPVSDARVATTRKDAWFAGVRVQIVRLGREAARSACQALSTRRNGRSRTVYELHIDSLITQLASDTPDRVRRAREAGAAPLDLGLAAALLGVRDVATAAARDARIVGVTDRHVSLAELLDRTWDNLAHGTTRELEQALGGNPRLLRHFTGRRV